MEKIKSKVRSITREKFHKILDGEGEWFLLDVRNDIEFEEWRLEGKKTPSTLNIPYYDFFDNEEEQVRKLPTDRPILVVCTRGDSSAYVVDILQQNGLEAVNLKGGTVGWGDYYEAKDIPGYGTREKGERLLQINRVAKGCLSYMLISGKEALVVDPARHIGTYLNLAEKEGVKITYIMDTHLHADHISGGAELAKVSGGRYYIQEIETEASPLQHLPLPDGEVFKIGGSRVEVIAHLLPGHTPGSTSFLIDHRFLLTGDTLFVKGVGRPDLGGMAEAWARMLYDSLFRKLAQFTEDLVILPAHFSDPKEVDAQGLVMGSLTELREKNEALQIGNEEKFVHYIQDRITSQPSIYQDIRQVNLKRKEVDETTASEMEIGKNECAAAPH